MAGGEKGVRELGRVCVFFEGYNFVTLLSASFLASALALSTAARFAFLFFSMRRLQLRSGSSRASHVNLDRGGGWRTLVDVR